MVRNKKMWLSVLMVSFLFVGSGFGNTINAANLVLRSVGSVHDGTGWMMSELGYVGCFVNVSNPTTVTVSIKAAGAASNGVYPVMDVHIANQKASWQVSGTPPYTTYSTYTANFNVPQGLYFVRIELTNANLAGRTLYLKDVTITGSNVSVDNNISEDRVLTAANDYISNFRRGNFTLNLKYGKNLSAVPQNTAVSVKHKKHHFRFSGTVYGVNLTDPAKGGADWLSSSLARAYWYREYVKSRFNGIVLEDAGKWIWNEPQRDVHTLQTVDTILNWAKTNDLAARIHALLYSDKSESGGLWTTPAWLRPVLAAAYNGDQNAKQDYRQEITERIGYLIADRAHLYTTFEAINEDNFTNVDKTIFGFSGLAEIFNEARTAANNKAKMIVNEAQIFTLGGPGGDHYANWYKNYLHQIQLAGGQFDGVGMQAHFFPGDLGFDAVRVFKALQTLCVFEKDMVVTEFSCHIDYTRATSAQILDKMMRLAFGTPYMVEFTQWSWYDNYGWNPGAALVGANGITYPPGVAYDNLVMNSWRTNLNLQANASGQVSFFGYFGDYEISVGKAKVVVSLSEAGTYQVNLECIQPNIADLNKDCLVNLQDLSVMSKQWLDEM